MRITVYNQGLKAEPLSSRERMLLLDFSKDLCSTESIPDPKARGKFGKLKKVTVVKDRYYGRTKDSGEWRFHASQLEDLLTHLRKGYLKESELQVRYDTSYSKLEQATPALLERMPHVAERPEQVKPIAFCKEDAFISVIHVQPGFGKTFVASVCAADLKVRVGLVTPARYIDRWFVDFDPASEKRVVDMRGGGCIRITGMGRPDAKVTMNNGIPAVPLLKAIDMVEKGEFDYDFIAFSTVGLREYIKLYEENPADPRLKVKPEKLFEYLGIGLKVVDEGHEEFHFHHRLNIYTNVPRSIVLSGTLISDDELVQRMYAMNFPQDRFFDSLEYNKYVGVLALIHGVKDRRKIKWKGKRGSYSQIEYEDSIFADRYMRANYLELIKRWCTTAYVMPWAEGFKALIYVGRTDYCEQVADYLREHFGDRFTVAHYIGETELDVLYNNDIVVTTLGSCGTGKDINGLKEVLNTHAIQKREKNEQAKGRLREIKGLAKGDHPRYWYLVNRHVRKHVDYHKKKLDQFRGRCIYHKEIRLNFDI